MDFNIKSRVSFIYKLKHNFRKNFNTSSGSRMLQWIFKNSDTKYTFLLANASQGKCKALCLQKLARKSFGNLM